jgi:hypothetical protein
MAAWYPPFAVAVRPPLPTGALLTTVTEMPALAASRAALNPAPPAPIISTSVLQVSTARELAMIHNLLRVFASDTIKWDINPEIWIKYYNLCC